MALTVGLAGLGAIGFTIAKGLDAGLEGLKLTLVAVSDVHHAKARLAQFSSVPHLLSLSELAEADIVIEALPALLSDWVAGPAIEAGKLFIPSAPGFVEALDAGRTGTRNRRKTRRPLRRDWWA